MARQLKMLSESEKYPLHPYQEEAISYMKFRKIGLLAMDMGLGKTRCPIELSKAIIKAWPRILVICPASVKMVWGWEWEKWGGKGELRVESYHFARDHLDKLMENEWDMLILDESHNLKGEESQWTDKIFGKGGLATKCRRVYALSGTPMPNHPGEMWTILRVAGATKLSKAAFETRFCFVTIYGGKRRIRGVRMKRVSELNEILDGFWFRRKKEEVLKDLPKLVWGDVTLGAGEVDIMKAFPEFMGPNMEEFVLDQVEKERTTFNQAPSFEELGESVATLRKMTGLQKVDGIASLVLSELQAKAYEKIVIFVIHRDVAKGLSERFRAAQVGHCVLTGETSPKGRKLAVESFSKDPNKKVFIGNIIAAGVGIDLTAAHQVLFAEYDWVPGNNAQAAMRCHRLSQKNDTVFIRVASLEHSIDMQVNRVVKRKEEALSHVL